MSTGNNSQLSSLASSTQPDNRVCLSLWDGNVLVDPELLSRESETFRTILFSQDFTYNIGKDERGRAIFPIDASVDVVKYALEYCLSKTWPNCNPDMHRGLLAFADKFSFNSLRNDLRSCF